MNTRSAWTLRRILRPYAGRLLWGAVLLLLTNLVAKAIPWALRIGIDALVAKDVERVAQSSFYVLALAAVMWAVRTWSRIQVFNVGRDVEYGLRMRLLRSIHRRGTEVLKHFPTGDLLSRSIQDLGQVRLLVGFGFLNLVNAIFSYIGALVLMCVLHPKLTLHVLLPFPLFFVVARIFGQKIFRRSKDAQLSLAKLSKKVHENVSGARMIRSLALGEHELKVFEGLNQEVLRNNMRIVALRGLLWPVLSLLTSVATLIAIWRGGQLVLQSQMSAGDLTAFLAYLGQLVPPTLAFGWVLSIIQRGRVSAARVFEVIAESPEATSPANEQRKSLEKQPAAELRVRNLSFSYAEEGQSVLRHISLEISPGSLVAVVGKTAAGKSTLGRLLTGLLVPQEGDVFLNGKRLQDIEQKKLRSEALYADQEAFLFSRSIKENLRFGNSADDDDLGSVLDKVEVSAEVASLSQGLDTLVGQRGVQLSGGQRQRVALARALLYQPSLLVLDDPMSAVDAKTADRISQSIRSYSEESTVVLITHQVALARACDRIFVLNEGEISDEGSHEELLKRSAPYRALAAEEEAA